MIMQLHTCEVPGLKKDLLIQISNQSGKAKRKELILVPWYPHHTSDEIGPVKHVVQKAIHLVCS